jgi:rod shape-determining protein MreD
MEMELTKKNLAFLFFAGLLLTMFWPILSTSVHIAFLIPFIITAYYQKSHIASLWYSLICGLIVDMLSSSHRMGLNGLSYTLTTLMLYDHRMHFFGDRKSTLPIMTFFFAFLSKIFFWILNYVFEKNFSLSDLPFIKELIFIPLINAAYAYGLYYLPKLILRKRSVARD